jgi:phosphatidylserine synthase
MLQFILTIPFFLKAMYTVLLYIFCISYGVYNLARFLYKPSRDKSSFNKIDWIVNMFMPLMVADLLGSFAADYFGKSQITGLSQSIMQIMLWFNNLSYLIRTALILATTGVIAFRIVKQVRTKNYQVTDLARQSAILLFFGLLLLLYPIDTNSGYIFGKWNRL